MSSAEPTLVVGRAYGTVVVKVRGDLDAAAMTRLDRVLADLVHGQGNMAVVADLSGAVATPAALEAFLTGLRERFPGTKLTVRRPTPAKRGRSTAVR